MLVLVVQDGRNCFLNLLPKDGGGQEYGLRDCRSVHSAHVTFHKRCYSVHACVEWRSRKRGDTLMYKSLLKVREA